MQCVSDNAAEYNQAVGRQLGCRPAGRPRRGVRGRGRGHASAAAACPTRRSVPDWFPTAHFVFRPSGGRLKRSTDGPTDGRTDAEGLSTSAPISLRSLSPPLRSSVRSLALRPSTSSFSVVVCCHYCVPAKKNKDITGRRSHHMRQQLKLNSPAK